MFSDCAFSFVANVDGTPVVPSPKPRNEREHERIHFQSLAAAKIHPPPWQQDRLPQECYVLARDLSLGGISFLHPVPLREGQRVDLQFADGRKCSVVIKWARWLEDYCYMMGCQFAKAGEF